MTVKDNNVWVLKSGKRKYVTGWYNADGSRKLNYTYKLNRACFFTVYDIVESIANEFNNLQAVQVEIKEV